MHSSIRASLDNSPVMFSSFQINALCPSQSGPQSRQNRESGAATGRKSDRQQRTKVVQAHPFPPQQLVAVAAINAVAEIGVDRFDRVQKAYGGKTRDQPLSPDVGG